MDNFLEKRDFKAQTIFNFYVSIDVSNEKEESDDKKNHIIFITPSGRIEAEKILPNKFEGDEINSGNTYQNIFNIGINARDNVIQEHGNEDLHLTETSFILENVKIYDGSANLTTVPLMILFSEQVVGLTAGRLDQPSNQEY